MRELIITANDSGQRADRFISKLMPGLPLSMLYKGLRKKCVKLNGKHLKDGSVFLNTGDVLTLYFKDEFFKKPDSFSYVTPELDIVYEDENIIVVNKAVGVLSHADESRKGITLIDMLKSYLYDIGEYEPETEQSFSPALCNRLDRNTGGLVICAKNASSLREMNRAIKERQIQKFYTAIATGHTPEKGHIKIGLIRKNKVTRVSESGKEAELFYTKKAEKDNLSLLEIELKTGRTHQIRTQLAHMGHPLLGDTKYGGDGTKFRQALWSTRLIMRFDKGSPLSYLDGKEISVSAPFEKKFKE